MCGYDVVYVLDGSLQWMHAVAKTKNSITHFLPQLKSLDCADFSYSGNMFSRYTGYTRSYIWTGTNNISTWSILWLMLLDEKKTLTAMKIWRPWFLHDVSTPPPSLLVYWRYFFSQSTSVYSALGADFSALMRYINSRFTYLLTYLLAESLSYNIGLPYTSVRTL